MIKSNTWSLNYSFSVYLKVYSYIGSVSFPTGIYIYAVIMLYIL